MILRCPSKILRTYQLNVCILTVNRVSCLPSVLFVMISGTDEIAETLENVSLDAEGKSDKILFRKIRGNKAIVVVRGEIEQIEPGIIGR